MSTTDGHALFVRAARWALAHGWRQEIYLHTEMTHQETRRSVGWREYLDPDHGYTRLLVGPVMAPEYGVPDSVQVTSVRQAVGVLVALDLLPASVLDDPEPADDGNSEWQWGVRTTYTDGSSGIDWTNQDEAESFLVHYAEVDYRPGMDVQTRELVRRRIVPRQVHVQPFRYAELRAAAEERAGTRRVPPTPGTPAERAAWNMIRRTGEEA